VKVPEEIRLRAIAAVDKMLQGKFQIPGTKS
jgi:hypothetical protein